MLDCKKRATDVDIVSLDPQIYWDLPDRILMTLVCDSGICNKNVDGPEMVSGGGNARRDGVFIGDISLYDMQICVRRPTDGSKIMSRDLATLI